MHFVWFRSTSLRVFKFLQIKELAPNFWGGTNFSECLDYLVLLLYFNLKSSMEPNSSSFIKFQSILLEPERLFWESWNFCKLKRDLISGGNQFCRMSELFGPPSCISILKVFQTQILHHSLHFNVFCIIQEYFSKSPEISTN